MQTSDLNAQPVGGSRTRSVVLAAVVLFGVALELGAVGAWKVPGHRALPGALAVLSAAELLGASALLVLGGAMALASALLSRSGALGAVPLVALAGVWSRVSPARRTALTTILAGAAYGLARGLLATGGGGTSMVVRLGGHLFFGALGGLAAHSISRATR